MPPKTESAVGKKRVRKELLDMNRKIKSKKYIKFIAAIIILLLILNYRRIYDGVLFQCYDIDKINFSNSPNFDVLVTDGEYESDIVRIENEEQRQKLVSLINSLDLIKKSPDINIEHNKYAFIYVSDRNIGVIGVAGNYIKIWPKDSDDSNFTTYYILNSDYNIITDTNEIYRYLKKLVL